MELDDLTAGFGDFNLVLVALLPVIRVPESDRALGCDRNLAKRIVDGKLLNWTIRCLY